MNREKSLRNGFIILKLILLILFTSEYDTNLFRPFLDNFVTRFDNPWQFYFSNGLNLESFPYHGLMLYLLAPFAYLLNHFHIQNQLVANFIFKFPLLVADISIFIMLLKLFPLKEKKVVIFYFLNPIILYAVYVHSQLDIIPMAILFMSLYCLVNNKLNSSAIILGLAIATKFHVLVVLPIVIFYVFKKHSFKTALRFIYIPLLILLILDLPFLFSDGFIEMVILNPKQSLLFDSFYKIGSLKLFLPIVSILAVYLHFFNYSKVNRDLLYYYIGWMFAVTIFFIYPSPAWYVWLIPFLSIYFIQRHDNYKCYLLYLSLSITYLIFFIFFYEGEYIGVVFLNNYLDLRVANETISNIFFTILEVMLLAVMYVFYKYAIKSNSLYKKKSNLVIGIGGGSGAGKTMLLHNIALLLGDRLLEIEGDGEHKWERGNENWEKFTHLDPKANHIHHQAQAIVDLKYNYPVYRSDYKHDTGTFSQLKKINPKEFIAISGLHPFYLPKLRKSIDLKIYLDTDEKLMRHWKVIRDINKRGYSQDSILKQINDRVGDTEKYIYPQKEYADLVVRFFGVEEFTLGAPLEEIPKGLKITFDASINVEDFLDKLGHDSSWDYNDDLKTQYIILYHEPEEDFNLLANLYIKNINEIIDAKARFLTGYNGFIQFISLIMISEKLKEVD